MKKAQLARREERNAKRQRDAEENREHQRRAHAKGMRARKAKREWVYEEVSDSLASPLSYPPSPVSAVLWVGRSELAARHA